MIVDRLLRSQDFSPQNPQVGSDKFSPQTHQVGSEKFTPE
jgi:hypothetical protein